VRSLFRNHIDAGFEDELFNLIPTPLTCYVHGMQNRQAARHLRGLLAFGQLPLNAGKTVFDGTKLPLVVGPSKNHNRRYMLSFS
jgi:hypothetical protein